MTARKTTFLFLILLGGLFPSTKIYSQASNPPPSRWAIDLDMHWAVSKIEYSYLLPSSGVNVEYEGPYNAKGLQATASYVHKSLRVGVGAAFQHVFYWASEQVNYIPYQSCPTGQPCTVDTSLNIVRGGDQLPRLRLGFAPSLQWMPKVGQGVRVGFVAEPGFYFYPNDDFLPNRNATTKYSLGFQPKLEAGVQFLLQTSPDDAILLKFTGIKSNFKPLGYFEDAGATDLEQIHQALRISLGYSVGF
jgi:hypothetical protein